MQKTGPWAKLILTLLTLLLPTPSYGSKQSNPDPGILFSNADAKWRSHQWNDAIGYYKTLVDQFPTSSFASRAHIQLGVYLKYQKRWEDAFKDLERILRTLDRQHVGLFQSETEYGYRLS